MFVLAVLAYLYVFWLIYLAIMSIYRAHLLGTLSKTAWYLAIPVLIIGLALDWIANWTIAAVLFAEMPSSPYELVTDRLSRYINGAPGWRNKRARWVCQSLLNSFDPSGAHCK